MRETILIIDDNIKLCKSLGRNFDQLGFNVLYKNNGTKGISSIKSDNPDVVLLDVSLGDENGLEILETIKKLNPIIPVIMITGYGTIEIAVKAIKNGAFDFIQKPLEFNKLLIIVENALKIKKLNIENRSLKKRVKSYNQKIISANSEVLGILQKAERLAKTEFPILIQGESGTGKEGLAEYIHNNSNRSSMNIEKINCSAFPENLLDNELFGHEKGAYTGASTSFKGIFEKADGGTLLLDEIGDMSLQTQAKILRTLQNKEIKPIGAEKTKYIDVRFIASSNKDLKELIKKKLFREDLYYRLTTATLYLPPLRERKEDIPLLAEHFLKDFFNSYKGKSLEFSELFLDALINSEWKGNIRELKNIIHYASAICVKDTLGLEDLPPSFLSNPTVNNTFDLIKDNEKDLITKTLQKTGNNKKKTAELLKISRKTLYNKMDKYEIQH